jgi:hypothetical protein
MESRSKIHQARICENLASWVELSHLDTKTRQIESWSVCGAFWYEVRTLFGKVVFSTIPKSSKIEVRLKEGDSVSSSPPEKAMPPPVVWGRSGPGSGSHKEKSCRPIGRAGREEE